MKQARNMLGSSTKVHGIDAEGGLALQYCCADPVFALPLDLCGGALVKFEIFAFVSEADCRHYRLIDAFKRGVLAREFIELFSVFDITIDPAADFFRAVS